MDKPSPTKGGIQLALVKNVSDQCSTNPKSTSVERNLNPAVLVFSPNLAGTRITKKGESASAKDKEMEITTRKKSTTQCVSRSFGNNNETNGDNNVVKVAKELTFNLSSFCY